jgi:hypothetical protein
VNAVSNAARIVIKFMVPKSHRAKVLRHEPSLTIRVMLLSLFFLVLGTIKLDN